MTPPSWRWRLAMVDVWSPRFAHPRGSSAQRHRQRSRARSWRQPLTETGDKDCCGTRTALPEDNICQYELQEVSCWCPPDPTVAINSPPSAGRNSWTSSYLPTGRASLTWRWWCAPSIRRSCGCRMWWSPRSAGRLPAAAVLLAVEIVSPGSRNVDLHLKPFEYADAGDPALLGCRPRSAGTFNHKIISARPGDPSVQKNDVP